MRSKGNARCSRRTVRPARARNVAANTADPYVPVVGTRCTWPYGVGWSSVNRPRTSLVTTWTSWPNEEEGRERHCRGRHEEGRPDQEALAPPVAVLEHPSGKVSEPPLVAMVNECVRCVEELSAPHQPMIQLGVLGRDEIRAEPADGEEVGPPVHRVAAADAGNVPRRSEHTALDGVRAPHDRVEGRIDGCLPKRVT